MRSFGRPSLELCTSFTHDKQFINGWPDVVKIRRHGTFLGNFMDMYGCVTGSTDSSPGLVGLHTSLGVKGS